MAKGSKPGAWIPLIIFLLLLAAYAAMHWGLLKLFSAFFPRNIVLPLIVALGASSIASLFIVHWKRNIATRIYYLIGMSWMGLALISFTVLVPIYALRKIAGIAIPGYAALAIIALLALIGIVNAKSPRTTAVDLGLKGLRRQLRIVQLSDIHIGEINTPAYLAKVVRRTNLLRPDVVVITGDLFDGGEKYPDMIIPLSELNAKHVLFVTGNHEIYTGREKTIAQVRDLGMTVIDDRVVIAAGVQFAGVGYRSTGEMNRTVRKLGRLLDKRKPAILLRHTPDGLRDAADAGFCLQLSGHTHAGQIWPFNYLVMLVHQDIAGLYCARGSPGAKTAISLYVSPGTGTWGPPFRIGSRSEITLIRLHPA